MSSRRPFLEALGPGLLLAGAAIGVSHLVQSTRAGAVYGFGLLWVVLLANVVKYAAFRFGPQYTAATGTSLLEGYRRQGRLALIIVLILTVGTMFTIQAAVSIVTAGLAKITLGLTLPAQTLAALLMALSAVIIAFGRYRVLDAINKVIVLALTLSTLAAALLLLPKIDWHHTRFFFGDFTLKDMAFAAALVGWMPSAVDVAVWHSLWTLARADDTAKRPSMRAVIADFHLGYWGAAGLALCFVILGAGAMHGTGAVFSDTAAGFAAQVVDLYTAALGAWSRPLISVSAFAVMFSTTLAVVDGLPRTLAVLIRRFYSEEQPWAGEAEDAAFKRLYWGSLLLIGAGAVALLFLMIGALTPLVDLATTLSFLTAPALAWFNHRAVCGEEVPPAMRPSRGLRYLSLTSIGLLTVMSLGYLLFRAWARFA
ncbi:divalent metal cation transporter [Myxococcota bacterium]|nr:divalent metal cation transporter [Myxococcota bacterium]MBU1431736.1 divalent metal cation transporter [Myxococcota bacterium]MBU1898778.1 divalent metal cation transporter [Myxococcota bacterium]